MIKEAIAKVVAGQDLMEAEMVSVMNEIMTGQSTPSQIGAFLTALRMKGETVEEITGAAKVMREKAEKIDVNNHLVNIDRDEINAEDETLLDIVGTGGTAPEPSMSPPPPPLWRPAPGYGWPNTVTGQSRAFAAAPMCWKISASTWTSTMRTWSGV